MVTRLRNALCLWLLRVLGAPALGCYVNRGGPTKDGIGPVGKVGRFFALEGVLIHRYGTTGVCLRGKTPEAVEAEWDEYERNN